MYYNIKMSYYLYTDASKKDNLLSYAGVILNSKYEPLCEFVFTENNLSVTIDSLERIALFHGLKIAESMNIKNINVFSDNLNNINIINKININTNKPLLKEEEELINKFNLINFKYISREKNLYANALSKLPYNIFSLGNVNNAYHGINRAKNKFYCRLKNIPEPSFGKQLKSKGSLSLKLNSLLLNLYYISSKDEQTDKDILRFNKMFKKLYLIFIELNSNNVKIDLRNDFLLFLKDKNIKESFYINNELFYDKKIYKI